MKQRRIVVILIKYKLLSFGLKEIRRGRRNKKLDYISAATRLYKCDGSLGVGTACTGVLM